MPRTIGWVALLVVLAASCAPPQEPSPDEQALYRAIEENDLQKVRTLLERNHALALAADEKGWTPLHEAAFQNRPAMVLLLLGHGAALDARTHIDYTPLHETIWQGHVASARALIDAGADVNARSSDEWVPLSIAASRGDLAMVQLLVRHGADISPKTTRDVAFPMHEASGCGHTSVVAFLLSAGAEAGEFDSVGWTALHYAAFQGREDTTKVLISAGAPLNAHTLDEKATPLHTAATGGHPAIVKLLLDHGADRNATDENGRTPLFLADPEDAPRVVELLRHYRVAE